MMRISTQRNSRENFKTIEYKNFSGYNMNDVEENLRYGILTEGSYDVDLGRKLGAIAKRYGIKGQFETPNVNPIQSIYNYRNSVADKFMMQREDILYNLSAAGGTVTLNDFATFTTGSTLTNTSVRLTGEVELGLSSATDVFANYDFPEVFAGNVVINSTKTVGQTITFDVPVYIGTLALDQYIEEGFYEGAEEFAELTLNVYDDDLKSNLLYTNTCFVQPDYAGILYFDDAMPSIGRPPFLSAGQYYFEITSSSTKDIYLKTGVYSPPDWVYDGGNMYDNGVEDITQSLYFTVICTEGFHPSGSWVRTFDLAAVPIDGELEWTDTSLNGSSITCNVYNSNDNINFGSAYKMNSGNKIPLSRYLKIEFILSAGDIAGYNIYTPSLEEVKLSYSSTYDTETQVTAAVLTDKVRYAEYADVLYFTGGIRPMRYTGIETGTSGCAVGFESPYFPAAPTVAEGSATGITGTFKYKVTFVNDWGAESNPSPASSSITVANKKVSLSDISVEGTTRYAGHRAVRRNIYRTKNVGAVGINKWTSAVEVGTFTLATGAILDSGSTYLDRRRTASFIKIRPSTTYAVSANGAWSGGMYFLWYDKNLSYISHSGAFTVSRTAPATAEYVKLMMKYNDPGDAFPVEPTNFQLEIGEVPTDFQEVIYAEEDYYFVDSIDNNTATTYTDTTPDTDLLFLMDEDNYPPPKSSIIYEHKNYMFYVASDNETDEPDKSKLWFSKVGMPDSVPRTSYKLMPGPILGIHTYANALIVGGNNFTMAVIGDIFGGEADNTTVRELSSSEGPVSHESMVRCYSQDGDILIFPTRYGLRYLTPGLQENSLHTTTLSYPIEPMIRGLSERWNMTGAFYRDRYYLAMNYFGTLNNIIMVFDFRSNQWNPPWRIPANSFAIVNNQLYAGSPSDGQINLMEAPGTGTDDDEDIGAVAVLASTFAGAPHIKKRFVQVRLTKDSGTTTDMFMEVDVDGVSESYVIGNSWLDKMTMPRKRLKLPRGYTLQITLADYSRDDWIISRVIVEFERGEL